jgi:hypothetical protein
MKEKILETIYKKLCEGFNTNFYTLSEFEKEFSAISKTLLDTLISLSKDYQDIRNSTDRLVNSQIIRFQKDVYILDCYNSELWHNYHRKQTKYTIENLPELKAYIPIEYERFSNNYDRDVERDYDLLIVSITEFIAKKTIEYISLTDDQKNNSKEKIPLTVLFWSYFHIHYYENEIKNSYHNKTKEEILNTPEKVLQNFKESYLENKYLKLHEAAGKYLNDESISGLDSYLINVGVRVFEGQRAGWSNSKFQVLNNGKEYTFSNSSKDEKAINGEYINIFIFQKKYLIKLSISLDEVERLRYIIQRDFEKITLKNDCELVIIKHHGNETIILDSRKEALVFQEKLLDIREGNYRK